MTQPAQLPVQHPLLTPFTEPQQAVFDVLAESFVNGTAVSPLYGYVERRLDQQGYALEEILPTFPSIGTGLTGGGLYSAIWYQPARTDEPMGLSLAGLAHLPGEHQQVVQVYLAAVREMAWRRANDPIDPLRCEDPAVASSELVGRVNERGSNWLGWLPNLMRHEPPTWSGEIKVDPSALTWTWRCTRALRHFVGVEVVDDYLVRVSAYLEPPVQSLVTATEEPPLGFAAALDFLDTVWQLNHGGARLVRLPGASLITAIGEDAISASEFDARLSALGQVLKGLEIARVPGVPPHPVQWLGATLRTDLPPESHPRIDAAIRTLGAVIGVRNAMQHTQAAAASVEGLKTLGLPYPVTDWAGAWRTIRTRATGALWALREEMQAAGAASPP